MGHESHKQTSQEDELTIVIDRMVEMEPLYAKAIKDIH